MHANLSQCAIHYLCLENSSENAIKSLDCSNLISKLENLKVFENLRFLIQTPGDLHI